MTQGTLVGRSETAGRRLRTTAEVTGEDAHHRVAPPMGDALARDSAAAEHRRPSVAGRNAMVTSPPDKSVHVDLNDRGDPVDTNTGQAVSPLATAGFLADRLRIPPDVTDIVVFVHGWRTSPAKATRDGARLATLIANTYQRRPDAYPAIADWSPYLVTVRWPSMSSPFSTGYRHIRDRAHAMTTTGRAANVLGQLLGYLDEHRTRPGGPTTLRTAAGQYLHCVGHSFGGRFLVEATQAAADRRPPVLGWHRPDPRYPYTLDTLLIFQMAALSTVFAGQFERILHDAPINGPIVLTWSTADRATGLWHRLAEGESGIGYVGALKPADQIGRVELHDPDTAYRHDELAHRIVNIDASRRYRRGRRWYPAGAHSDIWHPESAHLLLSLANLAR
jgi:hypothetical protein